MYRISIREQSWLQVARMLYERMPVVDQKELIEQIPNLDELDKQSQIIESILKLVEIEAFRLERIGKGLPDISEEQISGLYQRPILYGSLVSSLINTKDQPFSIDKQSAFQYIYRKIQEEVKTKKEKPLEVHVSEEMFEKLLIEMRETKTSSISEEVQENLNEVMKTKEYEGFVVLIMGCSVTSDADIKDQKISFLY